MLYAYQLRSHANARYQQSLQTLCEKELACMLDACGVDASIAPQTLGGAPFLCFEYPALTDDQSAFLAKHSGVYMICALERGMLKPLDRGKAPALPGGMPDLLKYKGKTNADFTRMLLNLSLCAGGRWNGGRLRVLDPLCGRGTTLYCALERGMDADGMDSSAKELHEGVTYAKRWLQYNRVKHTAQVEGLTLPGGGNAPVSAFHINGEQTLRFIQADTRHAGVAAGKTGYDALVADLPYGVQHAPNLGKAPEPPGDFLQRALPAWRQALTPGAAAAIAFNTYTIPRKLLCTLAMNAGFHLMDSAPYGEFAHWVEQAVNRDVLIARNPRS